MFSIVPELGSSRTADLYNKKNSWSDTGYELIKTARPSEIAAVFQTTILNLFSWLKICLFWLTFRSTDNRAASVHIIAWHQASNMPLPHWVLNKCHCLKFPDAFSWMKMWVVCFWIDSKVLTSNKAPLAPNKRKVIVVDQILWGHMPSVGYNELFRPISAQFTDSYMRYTTSIYQILIFFRISMGNII